jgi:hypothetical protein
MALERMGVEQVSQEGYAWGVIFDEDGVVQQGL